MIPEEVAQAIADAGREHQEVVILREPGELLVITRDAVFTVPGEDAAEVARLLHEHGVIQAREVESP